MGQQQANPSEFPNSSFMAYLSELAAEIVTNGNPHGDLIAEATAAHARRQQFAAEMHAGKTERSRMARRLLIADIQGRAIVRGLTEQALEGCADIRRATVCGGELVSESYRLEGWQ